MNQIKALLRTTWWLWLLLFAGIGGLARYVEPAVLVMLPLCVIIFFYFAFGRFDENGERRG